MRYSLIAIVALITLAAGCAKPPLEEIASAEAALQAAREAEAPKYAPQPYGEAENLMAETYRLNDLKDYENTKTKAIATRDKADEARALALKNRGKRAADDEAAASVGSTGASAAATRAKIESEEIGKGAMDEGARIRSLDSVYFAFDDYTISSSEMAKVQAAAAWLKANPTAKVKIEGHTDERGSNDYNFALGSRRANAVRQMLATLGIEANRMATQSFGEETPADPGHNEAAWARNRRADFVVSQ